MFFGAHVVPLGYLLYRSRMVPRALGALVAVAGVLPVIILVGELALVGWLLVKGVEPRKAPLSGR